MNMKSTLKKLWNGEISPWSAPEPTTMEFRKIAEKVDKERALLESMLNEDGRKILENFESFHCEWLNLENENAFLQGFSLGMKMAAEAFLTN